jgi:5'-methylthioadenosine phosphorylase
MQSKKALTILTPMQEKVKIGIIGGTGLYSLDGMEIVEEVIPDTPWGKPSDAITIGKFKGKSIAFLPRHGERTFYSTF